MISNPLVRFLVTVIGSIAIACLLGIALDLVTANVAVDYFLVHHPRIVASKSPWVLAIVWGVAASWWFGAIVGLLIATINHVRSKSLPPIRILKWGMIAAAILWIVMIVILVAVLMISSTIPVDKRPATFEYDRRLVAVAMAHQYEYLFATIAATILGLMTWRVRSSCEVSRSAAITGEEE